MLDDSREEQRKVYPVDDIQYASRKRGGGNFPFVVDKPCAFLLQYHNVPEVPVFTWKTYWNSLNYRKTTTQHTVGKVTRFRDAYCSRVEYNIARESESAGEFVKGDIQWQEGKATSIWNNVINIKLSIISL